MNIDYDIKLYNEIISSEYLITNEKLEILCKI